MTTPNPGGQTFVNDLDASEGVTEEGEVLGRREAEDEDEVVLRVVEAKKR